MAHSSNTAFGEHMKNLKPPNPTVATPAMQDYLKAIYRLHEDAGPVTINRIADHLDVTAPSVSNMVKRLHAHGLVHHARYHGVTLTDRGKQTAIETIRHHRLLERYLVEQLGYALDEVHAEAEELEHYLSDELEAHIDMALGHPTVDPHGDPIPSLEGVLAIASGHPLVSFDVGVAGIVVRLSDDDPAKLRTLVSLDVLPGTPVMVLRSLRFQGPLRVRLGADEAECLLSRELAGAVFVQTLTDSTTYPRRVEQT